MKFPDEGLTLVFLCNLDRARLSAIVRDVSAIVLGEPWDMPVSGTVATLDLSFGTSGGVNINTLTGAIAADDTPGSVFRFTPLGLAMRAASQNPDSSRLVGIRVGWMLALGNLALAAAQFAEPGAGPSVQLEEVTV